MTCVTPPGRRAAYLSGVSNGGDKGGGEGVDEDDDESEGKPENNDGPREGLTARGGFAMRISGSCCP